MFVDVHVDADVCVLENYFISLCLILILYIFHTLWEVSPASGLVESPCDPFLRFHMRTHRRPADLAEASQWWIVEESIIVFSAQFRCVFTTLWPKTMLSKNLQLLEIATISCLTGFMGLYLFGEYCPCFTVWLVQFCKFLWQVINHRSQFPQPIVTWRSTWYQSIFICKVMIPWQFTIAITLIVLAISNFDR